MPTGNTGFYST